MFFQLFANRRKTIRFSMIRNRNANAFVQSNVSVNRKKSAQNKGKSACSAFQQQNTRNVVQILQS